MITSFVAVFIGGGIGSLLRYLTSLFCIKVFDTNLPVATLIVNLIACFIVGIATAYFLSKSHINQAWKLPITVGLCGGLSTFSTFSYEALYIFKDGNIRLGIFYIAFTIIFCLISTFLGFKLGKIL